MDEINTMAQLIVELKGLDFKSFFFFEKLILKVKRMKLTQLNV